MLAVRADGTHVCRLELGAGVASGGGGGARAAGARSSCRAFLRPSALADVGDVVQTPYGRAELLEVSYLNCIT